MSQRVEAARAGIAFGTSLAIATAEREPLDPPRHRPRVDERQGRAVTTGENGKDERPWPTASAGRVASINVSEGGVPKRPVERRRIGTGGLEGDRQRDRRHHGGPDRAVTLFSLERIEALQGEGHPISPGTIGENLTIAGVDWSSLTPGARLDVGEVRLEVTSFASPCEKIAASFRCGEFTRVAEKLHPGWSRLCARVVRDGTVQVGDPVRIVVASEDGAPEPRPGDESCAGSAEDEP